MPKMGTGLLINFFTLEMVSCAWVGSPGPLEMITPLQVGMGLFQGMVVTLRWWFKSERRMFLLAPQSMSTTCFWPFPRVNSLGVETWAIKLSRLGSFKGMSLSTTILPNITP